MLKKWWSTNEFSGAPALIIFLMLFFFGEIYRFDLICLIQNEWKYMEPDHTSIQKWLNRLDRRYRTMFELPTIYGNAYAIVHKCVTCRSDKFLKKNLFSLSSQRWPKIQIKHVQKNKTQSTIQYKWKSVAIRLYNQMQCWFVAIGVIYWICQMKFEQFYSYSTFAFKK